MTAKTFEGAVDEMTISSVSYKTDDAQSECRAAAGRRLPGPDSWASVSSCCFARAVGPNGKSIDMSSQD